MDDGSDRPLPDVDQGLLDAQGLETLLADVAACTELLEVRAKGGPRQHADPGALSLDQARQALLSGACRGVQLRYRYQDAEWWDTVLAAPGGYKVVRIRHDWSAG